MRIRRRALMSGVAVGGIAGIAGCASVLDDTKIKFSASGVRLPSRVQQETGYTHHRTYNETVTREFARLGINRTVEVNNVISEYDAALEIFERRIQAKIFATLSTPQVAILGQAFNPISDLSATEIANMIQQRYEQFGRITDDGFISGEIFGKTTVINRFRAEAYISELGFAIPVYLYINDVVEVGNDFMVGIAAHPGGLGRENLKIRSLYSNLVRGTPN